MKTAKFKIKSHDNFKLTTYKTFVAASPSEKESLKMKLEEDVEAIANYQNKLFAENRQSLLIILQGMDSSGKDGTIKNIMRGVNPQGVNVVSFKHPSAVELEHDYLWRHAIKLPEHGQITIFNRSHYENVLIARVHPEIVLAERLPGIETVDKIDNEFWKRRYSQINFFEKCTVDNGTQIVKLFLNISKEEQAKRFIERIEQKEKHWKFSSDDIKERGYWDDYQKAYEKMLKNTSTKLAPWYIIPADDKLYAHCLIAKIILEQLQQMNPKFPALNKTEVAFMQQAKKQLLSKNK